MCGFYHFSGHEYSPQGRASPPPSVWPCHFESFARVSLRHTSSVSAQTVFAAKYVKAFGLQFLVQSMPMFSLGRGSVSVGMVKR